MPSKPSSRSKSASIDPEATVSELVSLATVEAADRLAELGVGKGQDAKEARRGLHQLKQKGIEPSSTSKPPEVVAAQKPSAIEGFLTHVSGAGSQMCFFEEADPFGGAPMLHFFLTDFQNGLEEVVAKRIPRRDIPGVHDRLKRGETGLVVGAPADYVRHLVHDSAERLVRQGGRIPQGYADSMRRVGPAGDKFERSLIYDLVDADELAKDSEISREPEALFQTPYFRAWFLSMRAVSEWEEKYFEAVQSKFAVDQAQRDALGDKVVVEAADALIDSHAIITIRRSLEEQATVLHLAGHVAEAKQALVHAMSLDAEKPASENPFLLFYVKRSIYVLMAYKAEQEPDPEEPQEQPDRPLIERA